MDVEVSRLGNLLLRLCKEYGMSNNIIKGYENSIEDIRDYIISLGYTNVSIVSMPREKEITPRMCSKDRNSNYVLHIKGKKTSSQEITTLVEIPILVGSKWCMTYDRRTGKIKTPEKLHRMGECATNTGGYYIDKGTEMYIPTQCKLTADENHIYNKDGILYSTFKGYDRDNNSIMTSVYIRDKTAYIQTNFVKVSNIKVSTVLYLLLYADDKFSADELTTKKFESRIRATLKENVNEEFYEIVNLNFFIDHPKDIASDLYKNNNWEDTKKYFFNENSPYVGKATDYNEVVKVFLKHFIPTIDEKNYKYKITFICKMVGNLILVLNNYITPADRDDCASKLYVTAGQYINKEVKNRCRAFIAECVEKGRSRKGKEKDKPLNIKFIPNRTSASGNIAEVLQRTTPLLTKSQIQTIVIPTANQSKNTGTRGIHDSSIGYICLAETPTSDRVGLVGHFAVSCFDSLIRKYDDMYDIAKDYLEEGVSGSYDISINSIYVGKITEENFVKLKRKCKKNMDFFDVSFVVRIYVVTTTTNIEKISSFDIYCSGGRLTRPLINVYSLNRYCEKNDISVSTIDENNALWDEDIETLVKLGVIEYVAVNEQNYKFLIALKLGDITEEHSHCELHPSAQFGSSVNSSPFTNHNPAPRINHQSSMSKQAHSGNHTNWFLQTDTSSKRLLFPQKPLVTTMYEKILGLDILPNCFMAIVGIFATKQNNEDALTVSQIFLERNAKLGVLVTIDIETSLDKDRPIRGIPPEIKNIGKFHAIDPETGDPIIGRTVSEGDCIYSRYFIRDNLIEDKSVYCKVGQEGIVDHIQHIITGTSNNQSQRVRITLREHRIQATGDKNSARYSQKSVIGSITDDPPEIISGPFAGTKVDICINPMSLSSRGTAGMMLEMVISLASVLENRRVNGTTYDKPDMEWAYRVLEKHGINENCLFECQYEGEIVKMFVGPCAYQALRHHAEDKIKYCPTLNNPDQMYRQATKGAKGGIRYGNMESTAIVGHGTASIHNGIFNLDTDNIIGHVCETCSFLVDRKEENEWKCFKCNSTENVRETKMTYATVATMRHLLSAGVAMKTNISKVDNEDLNTD